MFPKCLLALHFTAKLATLQSFRKHYEIIMKPTVKTEGEQKKTVLRSSPVEYEQFCYRSSHIVHNQRGLND